MSEDQMIRARGKQGEIETLFQQAVDISDAKAMAVMQEPLPRSSTLQQVLRLSAADRGSVLALSPEQFAAKLVDEPDADIHSERIGELG